MDTIPANAALHLLFSEANRRTARGINDEAQMYFSDCGTRDLARRLQNQGLGLGLVLAASVETSDGGVQRPGNARPPRRLTKTPLTGADTPPQAAVAPSTADNPLLLGDTSAEGVRQHEIF
jgi:hypothetical protein